MCFDMKLHEKLGKTGTCFIVEPVPYARPIYIYAYYLLIFSSLLTFSSVSVNSNGFNLFLFTRSYVPSAKHEGTILILVRPKHG